MKLRQLSPALFAVNKPVPLKVGIFEDIVERLGLKDGARHDLGHILSLHVKRYDYLKSLVADGAVRLDLDGQSAGATTPEQRQRATETIAKIKAAHVAERQARNGKR